jgi:hypothetical protein
MKRGSWVGRAEQAKRMARFVGIPTAQNSIRQNKRRRQWLMIYAPVLTDGPTSVRIVHSYNGTSGWAGLLPGGRHVWLYISARFEWAGVMQREGARLAAPGRMWEG